MTGWHDLKRKETITVPKDDRTEEEKAEWDKGKFTEGEGKTSAEELNRQREEEERRAGNPLAPPGD